MPDEITGSELDRDVKAQLRGLGTDYSRIVGRHLVATHFYLESDPELAWRHALAARRRAARLGVVREAVGLAAYHSGRYADALAEFRTARRLTGSSATLPLMADSERGLGRPERALELARTPEARTLDQDGRIELLIVTAGARRDLGQPEAALVALQIPELETAGAAPWLARLRYAYADTLEAVGRAHEAAEWRVRALAADPEGQAGLAEVPDDDEIVVLDLLDDAEPGGASDTDAGAAETGTPATAEEAAAEAEAAGGGESVADADVPVDGEPAEDAAAAGAGSAAGTSAANAGAEVAVHGDHVAAGDAVGDEAVVGGGDVVGDGGVAGDGDAVGDGDRAGEGRQAGDRDGEGRGDS